MLGHLIAISVTPEVAQANKHASGAADKWRASTLGPGSAVFALRSG